MRPLLLLCLGVLLAACGAVGSPVAPTPTFDFGLERLPRATPRPVTPAPTASPGGGATVSFSGEVLPLLEQHCARCHGGIAGLWLTDYEHLMLGGDNGSPVRPGDPEGSVLYRTVEQGFMPPDAPPLTPDELRLLHRWIAEGAAKN